MQTSLEPVPHQKLRRAVEQAVISHQADGVICLLSPDSPLNGLGNCAAAGLEVLAGGFGAGISSASRELFLAFCLRMDSPDVVRAVVESGLASREQLLRSVCSWRRAASATAQHKKSLVKAPKLLQELHQGFCTIARRPGHPGATQRGAASYCAGLLPGLRGVRAHECSLRRCGLPALG